MKTIKMEYIQVILDKWSISISIDDILKRWSEPQRFYHTTKHLEDLLNKINQRKESLSLSDYEKLIIVALFHDIVYNPYSSTNEEDSAKFFTDHISKNDVTVDEIKQAILDTKSHTPTNFISRIFSDLDMSIVEGNYDELLEWESGIYNEFKMVGNDMYKSGRLSFLSSLLTKYPHNSTNLNKLIDWVVENY